MHHIQDNLGLYTVYNSHLKYSPKNHTVLKEYNTISSYIYVTHLHKTSLKGRFLHVEFKNPFCRALSVL